MARLLSGWFPPIRRYLAVSALGNLGWEFAHMPLYTLWRTASGKEVAWVALHCTAGDVLIAGAALAGSLLLFGTEDWPRSRSRRVAVATIAAGLGTTILVERAATAWGLWTYSASMPVLPGLGVGLTPVAQWVTVPWLAIWWAHPLKQRT